MPGFIFFIFICIYLPKIEKKVNKIRKVKMMKGDEELVHNVNLYSFERSLTVRSSVILRFNLFANHPFPWRKQTNSIELQAITGNQSVSGKVTDQKIIIDLPNHCCVILNT